MKTLFSSVITKYKEFRSKNERLKRIYQLHRLQSNICKCVTHARLMHGIDSEDPDIRLGFNFSIVASQLIIVIIDSESDDYEGVDLVVERLTDDVNVYTTKMHERFMENN